MARRFSGLAMGLSGHRIPGTCTAAAESCARDERREHSCGGHDRVNGRGHRYKPDRRTQKAVNNSTEKENILLELCTLVFSLRIVLPDHPLFIRRDSLIRDFHLLRTSTTGASQARLSILSPQIRRVQLTADSPFSQDGEEFSFTADVTSVGAFPEVFDLVGVAG